MIRRKTVKSRGRYHVKKRRQERKNMKREDIKAIFADATAEQIEAVMRLNNADVEKDKGKLPALEAELKEKKTALESLNAEFEQLKASNANAADWEKKFNDLSAEIAEKEKQAKLEREAKEKADMIETRFNAVVGEKKFTHEAIKADYLHKFGEALDNKDFMGKSDADIFHELTKDDKTAFEGVTTVQLAGGTNKGMGENIDEAHIRSVMGLPPLNK